jgi:hypothetical protein
MPQARHSIGAMAVFFVQLWCVLFRYSTANDLWHNTLLVIGNGTFHANQVPADFPGIKK